MHGHTAHCRHLSGEEEIAWGIFRHLAQHGDLGRHFQMEGGTGLPLRAWSRWQGATTVFKGNDCEHGTEAGWYSRPAWLQVCEGGGLEDSLWRVLGKVLDRL